MTAVAAILAVAFVVVSVVFVIVAKDRDDLRDVIEGLRDALGAAEESSEHWHNRARELWTRLEWSGNVTPSFVGERPSLSLDEHTADAQQRIEGGRVVRLPRQGGRA